MSFFFLFKIFKHKYKYYKFVNVPSQFLALRSQFLLTWQNSTKPRGAPLYREGYKRTNLVHLQFFKN